MKFGVWIVFVLIYLGPPGQAGYAGPALADHMESSIPVKRTLMQDPRLVESKGISVKFAEQANINLISLNKYINKWFLLEMIQKSGRMILHLENANPSFNLDLYESGLSLHSKNNPKQKILCPLWDDKGMQVSQDIFDKHDHAFFPICSGMVFIRLKKPSNTRMTFTEITTEVLRSLPVGEKIISYFKPFLVGLKAESDSGIKQKKDLKDLNKGPAKDSFQPESVKLKDMGEYNLISSGNQLGISIRGAEKTVQYGKWYESEMHSGVFVGLFKPELISDEILMTYPGKARDLKPEEKNKLVYMTAYDLNKFSLNYAVGTVHPAVNVSAPEFGKAAVLRESVVPVGGIPPYEVAQAIGVFVGGFKNQHSEFKAGPYKGRTYGYIENGLELEPMSPLLATMIMKKNGDADIIRWPEKEEDQLKLREDIVSARQNGSMVVADGAPGEFVSSWKFGNWSGSAEGLGQSLRAGICIQKKDDKKFLIFMAFTSATPSAMARVMQAYSCQNGMHLDMNAHMYLHNAIYSYQSNDQSFKVEYLHKEMLFPKNLKRHRFIMDNNQRDFFYIRHKNPDPDMFVTN